MEGEIGRFRRRHLVPVPHVASLAELNAADRRRRRRSTTPGGSPAGTVTVGRGVRRARRRCWTRCRPSAFDPAAAAVVPGRPRARVCVRQSLLLGPGPLRRPAAAGAAVRRTSVEVLDGGTVVARHDRGRRHKDTEDLVLDHYLEVLTRKPGALPGATALAQARAAGAFTAGPPAVLGRRPPPARATPPAPGP